MPDDLPLPQSLPARVGAWMSTRAGGVSLPPWDSLNLGMHVGDQPAHVARNRALWAQALGVRPVFLQQVHGVQVVTLGPQTPSEPVADACISFTPGLACTVMVADCLPVLCWDRQGRWVAAAHAGWRGLLGQQGHGVLEALAQALQAQGAQIAQAGVWLGPCIGPQAFEVGDEVREAFVADRRDAQAHFVPGHAGRWWAHLPALARQRLQALGVEQVQGNDGQPPWCTVSNPGRFFSHRRDGRGGRSTGRMAAAIALRG